MEKERGQYNITLVIQYLENIGPTKIYYKIRINKKRGGESLEWCVDCVGEKG
jgi:hypothetical protein